ncbi:Cell wall alpha-1,3-glucan synthase ags1, partial [Borealophlyctis nickersoniae]
MSSHTSKPSLNLTLLLVLILFSPPIHSVPWTPFNSPYNINQATNVQDPLLYTSSYPNHTYFPSPTNWRFPFYSAMLDRFADGDPSNNAGDGQYGGHETDMYGAYRCLLTDVNEIRGGSRECGCGDVEPLPSLNSQNFHTPPEHKNVRLTRSLVSFITEVNFRFGGDIQGLIDRLDYIRAMGIRGLYIIGAPFLNNAVDYHGYNPLDFTLLDPHFGTVDEWRALMTAAHDRGMYVMMDLTVGTMGDLIEFGDWGNYTSPINLAGYETKWKKVNSMGPKEYWDFKISNEWDPTCQLPQFWGEDGFPIASVVNHTWKGCYKSDFNTFGDIDAFDYEALWRRQITKFNAVQDRLRDWYKPVGDRIMHHACLLLQSLDFDAVRIDKSTQMTNIFLTKFTPHVRACARKLGKTNFLVTGEITAGETFGALFIGRGRQPDKRPATPEEAMNRSALTPQNFLWSEGKSSMDSQAFHYSIYRNMLRFLRLDSNDRARFDLSTDLVPAWHEILVNDDMWNLETGQFDPRHMFGVTNQDTIRWPAFTDGGLRQQLGHFVVNLVMPGIPLYYYGEEQNLYLHDGIAHNYMYGRQSMSSAPAWKLHGCYKGDKNNQKFYQAPFESVLDGCKDEEAQLDHFDTTHPSFLLVQHLSRVREEYAVVRDGLRVEVLGNWTYQEVLPGTSWMSTTVGLWSLSRSFYPTQQQPTNTTTSTTTPLWLLFTNSNTTITHSHPCTSDLAILAPFPAGTTVVNIFPPYDRVTLQNGRNASVGCMPQVSLPKYGYVAYVPEPQFRGPRPTVVGASPPHDARIIRQPNDANHTVPVSFVFSSPMASCEGVTAAVSVASVPGPPPRLSPASVRCSVVTGQTAVRGSGIPVATWKWEAVLQNVMDGVHTVSVAATIEGPGNLTLLGPSSRMFRVGSTFNPIVNTLVDYSPTLLTRNGDGTFAVNHDAAGASMFRLSLDYGKTWGPWTQLSGVTTLEAESFDLKVDGTAHVIVDYWCKPCSSSAHRIHGHYAAYPSPKTTPRRWPSLKIRGDFNDWGEDVGAASAMTFVGDGKWEMQLQAQFPCNASLDVFGDRMYAYGDFDRDGVLDRLPPTYTTANYIHFPLPPRGYLGWILTVDDATRTYTLTPTGVSTVSVFLFFLLALLPIIGGIVAVKSFENISYGVLFNMEGRGVENENGGVLHEVFVNLGRKIKGTIPRRVGSGKRLKVLIGTLEYDIPDWNIKVRIGGLGAIAGLMAKHMIKDKDLVWVVPKLGDVEYPEGEPSPPIEVTVLGRTYEVGVQLHTLEHLTYVLLDAGIFRARVKKDPYPARMDDLESAVLYSVWNQCIAAAMERFAVDVYHINDYHGALAPLYLLPKTIPCCLSLHNAAFQGLWPIRTRDERRQVCSAFNLRKAVVTKYIQFGNTFNLLHAAASYLRIHQNGVGCVGVSSRYATRVLARYPTLWGLSTIGSLPNPNPVDFGADGVVEESRPETVGTLFRKQRFRIEKKLEAQRWAHLKEDPDADLVVFVGRWSHQKGIDLIADLAPRILQEFPKVQLLCVGPIVDLHGKLAASKLQYLMEKDPDRVFSKAEFTSLPQAVFQGCDFVLIPSRDEPFGLVAVEFGRFGALGIGSFVGGLGSMPGWWFPIESAEVEHLLKQFWKTIKKGLNSPPDVREKMRSTAQKQRFPVEEWLEDLDDLYTKSIKAAERPAIVPPQAPPDVVSAAQNIEQEYTVQLRDQTDGPSNMTERQMSALSQPSQWPSMRRRPSKPPVVRFGGLDDIDEVGEMDEPPVLPWMARSRSRPSFSNQPRPAFADTIGRSTMSHPELALSPTRRPVSELSTLSNSTMNNDSILDDDMDGKTISFMPYDNYDSNDEDDLTPPPTHHLWPLATSPNFSDTLARANPHTLLRN